MKKWNHYHCPECNGVTIARHDDEGVTPFMLRCRATTSCSGMAQSCFFYCSQDDAQVPHVIFYRPATAQAIKDIRKSPKNERVWLMDHYSRGGSLMKEAA